MAIKLRIVGCFLILLAVAMVPTLSTSRRAQAQTPKEYWRIIWWNDSAHADTNYRQIDHVCLGVPRFDSQAIHYHHYDRELNKTKLFFVKGGSAVGWKLSEDEKARMQLPK